MINLIKLLYWKLFFRFKQEPHKNHIKFLLDKTKDKSKPFSSRKDNIKAAAVLYSTGMSINSTALYMGFTIERVRQLLIKFMRTNS